MPGLNVLIGKKEQISPDSILNLVLKNGLYTEDYKVKLFPVFDRFLVIFLFYPDYPVRHFSDDRYDYFLEGRLYNLTKLQEEQRIRELCPDIWENNTPDKKLNTHFGAEDGEFFLCIADRITRRWIIAGDYMGRLPVYECEDDSWRLYVRDLMLKRLLIPDKPDMTGIAEMTCFGYPLGNRTIYHHVSRLHPACYISENNGKRTTGTWRRENFEDYLYEKSDPRAIAGEAKDLFTESCRIRLRSFKNRVLSLSGGLDSRGIGSVLHRLELPFRVCSYLDPWNHAKEDVTVAGILAEIWKKNLDVIPLNYPTEEMKALLLKTKAGMNSLSMSFILGFFTRITDREMVYITGDGGDKVFPDLSWDLGGRNTRQLADHILKKHAILPSGKNRTEKLPGLILDSLMDVLESSPEKTMRGKYIRFLIMNRGFKWLFEGEDRNRYFFPSITPYYSVPLFDYLMRINPAVKKNYQVYKWFLFLVSPETCNVRNANWNFSVNQTKQIESMLFRQRVKYRLPRWTRNRSGTSDSQEFDSVRETITGIFPGLSDQDLISSVGNK